MPEGTVTPRWAEAYQRWRLEVGRAARPDEWCEAGIFGPHRAPDLCNVCGYCFDHCYAAQKFLEFGEFRKYWPDETRG